MMKRYLPLIAGALVLGLSGVVHGLWTDRWKVSAAMDAASARLEAIPARIGDWDSEPLEIDTRQLTIAEATGHLSRRYTHRSSGRQVSLLILCGRPGPLSVHRPDVCYTGGGYQLTADPEKWTLPGNDGRGQFWTARFSRPGTDASTLRVFWSWSSGGDWIAADQPRLTFAHCPVLYKFYLVQPLSRPDEAIDTGVGREFLRVIMPELQHCLSATTSPSE
jgi:hypothetical protein